MATFIALLRGINVGGHKKVPMAELRELTEELGYTGVQTYIQSGNLLLNGEGKANDIEQKLEAAIAAHFGFPVDTLVRTAKEWPALLKGNPFPEACAKEPNLVMMSLAKRTPNKDSVKALRERAQNDEKIEAAGEAIWIHYPNGVARSKLSPALIDRLVGSPVTARNIRTVEKLAELSRPAS